MESQDYGYISIKNGKIKWLDYQLIERSEYRFIHVIEIVCVNVNKLFTHNSFYRFEFHVNRILTHDIGKGCAMTILANLYESSHFSSLSTLMQSLNLSVLSIRIDSEGKNAPSKTFHKGKCKCFMYFLFKFFAYISYKDIKWWILGYRLIKKQKVKISTDIF